MVATGSYLLIPTGTQGLQGPQGAQGAAGAGGGISSGGTVATGSSITFAGNGPASTSGDINFTATGVLMAARNYNNTTDANIIKLDGAADLYFGDATPGIQDTNIVGDTVAMYSRGQAAQLTFDAVGNVTLSTTATVSLANPAATVSIQNQRYGAQRVGSDTPMAVASGIATAPSQFIIPFVGGANNSVAFEANMFVKETGAGGLRSAVGVPSGAHLTVGYAGPTGTDCFDVTSSSLSATALGTGTYAGTIGAPFQVYASGLISGPAGVTGPVIVSFVPRTAGSTGVFMGNSSIEVVPST